MRLAQGFALVVGTSTALSMDRDFSTWKMDYDSYFDCVHERLMPILDCFNLHLNRSSQPVQAQPEPEPESESEMPSVVEEADKPTGKLIEDQGDEEYRASIKRVFPFAAVDFNLSESRDTGLGSLGLKEFVIPKNKENYIKSQPQQCFDPCFEKKESLAELRDRVEYLEWRNNQAEHLLKRVLQRNATR